MKSEVDISLCRPVPAAVIRSGIQRAFVNRLLRNRSQIRSIVVISPWITARSDAKCPFKSLVQLIRGRRLPAYILTRRPANPEHMKAIEMLMSCDTAEVVYNDNIHAKVYACLAAPPHGFALLGSANLTANSAMLYEIGLLVIGVGPGTAIVQDLADFGLKHLRTRPESEVIKKISTRRL